MVGVKFGNKHSYKDYGLKWISSVLSKPEAKKYIFEVPGRDGLLDATESMGPVRYDNRTLTLEFDKQVRNHEEYKQLENRLLNDLQGKVLKIIFDTDSGYYYDGRIAVETKLDDGAVAAVTITAEVLPYKLKVSTTKKVVSGDGKITIANARMPTVPTITVDSDVSIMFGDVTLSFSSGKYKVPDFMLLDGDNKFIVTGKAKIVFEYQEGEF